MRIALAFVAAASLNILQRLYERVVVPSASPRSSPSTSTMSSSLKDAGFAILGKWRKLRQVPLWKSTAIVLKHWFARRRGEPHGPVFPDRRGERLTRSGIEKRLGAAVREASAKCPSLVDRKVSPHALRHTTAIKASARPCRLTQLLDPVGQGLRPSPRRRRSPRVYLRRRPQHGLEDLPSPSATRDSTAEAGASTAAPTMPSPGNFSAGGSLAQPPTARHARIRSR